LRDKTLPAGDLTHPLLTNEGRKGRSILLPYQQRWVNDPSPLKIWLAARQIGKSFAIAMEAVTEALEKKCNNLILSSSERQSKEVMQKVYSFLRYFKVRTDEVIAAERETREEVSLPNGSRIISLPSNPDTVRGFSGNVFLDEFAFHQDTREIWRAMYPTVTRGYKVRITSTPNGKQNMFYELWARPANGPEKETAPEGGACGGRDGFSRHRTDIHDASSEGLAVDIQALKSGMNDPDAWAQEFECRFVDEATAYITYEMITACEAYGATKEWAQPAFSSQGDTEGGRSPSSELYLGVDIGRKRDLTVFWLLEKVGDLFWTRMVREMQRAPFREQRDFLYSLLDGSVFSPGGYTRGTGVPLARRACIDSSGIGAQLAEEAGERFGPRVEAVAFTAAVKEDLAVTLRRRFEERAVRVPPDREIREDIHSVRKLTTPAGNTRFDAERTGDSHADRFWALALALHAGDSKGVALEYESVRQREFSLSGCW
jgi:phage FluMu gp28-like protein